MNPNPLISVIVPCFNGAKYLKDALDSIFAQTYRPLQVLVIDDGSTDASADIASNFPAVRYAYQPHAGLGAALNHGIERATGDYFGFLDADDLWTETKLAEQMACFQNDPALDIVFGHVQEFYDAPAVPGQHSRAPIAGFSKSAMLIRRRAFFRVGLFEPKWRVGDFIEWYIRAQEQGLSHRMLSQVVSLRRVHDGNMSARERQHHRAYVHILKESLDRRQGNT